MTTTPRERAEEIANDSCCDGDLCDGHQSTADAILAYAEQVRRPYVEMIRRLVEVHEESASVIPAAYVPEEAVHDEARALLSAAPSDTNAREGEK